MHTSVLKIESCEANEPETLVGGEGGGAKATYINNWIIVILMLYFDLKYFNFRIDVFRKDHKTLKKILQFFAPSPPPLLIHLNFVAVAENINFIKLKTGTFC